MSMSLSLLTLIFTFSSLGLAQGLNPLQTFHRCYGQITQLSAYNDPDYTNIKNRIENGADVIDECMDVLKRAKFQSSSSRMPSQVSTDSIKEAILNTFHQLHHSWFMDTSLPRNIGSGDVQHYLKNYFDTSEPALYYLNALFGDNVRAEQTWSSTENLRARRSEGVLQETIYHINSSKKRNREDMAFGGATPFPEKGKIHGVYDSPLQTLNYYTTTATTSAAGSFDYGTQLGLGAYGVMSYLLATVDESANFTSNGAMNVPRKWAKKMITDSLCRELPVVRTDDILHQVSTNPLAPEFRKAASCVECHSTMDRMASTIRGFKYRLINANNNATRPGGLFYTLEPVTMSTESGDIGWREEPDSDFHKRPTNGVFYFRDLFGNLHDVNLNSPADLAPVLSQLDDPYICMAKRYYAYFTGVDVPLTDTPGRDSFSTADSRHFNQVVSLGRYLKNDTNQSVMKLIEAILRLPDYQKSSFGVNNE